MEAIPDTVSPKGKIRHIPKKVALFRRAPALKRETQGGGVVSPFHAGDEGGSAPFALGLYKILGLIVYLWACSRTGPHPLGRKGDEADMPRPQ